MSPSHREPVATGARKLRNEAVRRKRMVGSKVVFSEPSLNGNVNYFLRRKSDDAVRIGYTTNFTARLAQHQNEAAGYNDSFETLAIVHGDKSTEAEIHAYFHGFRIRDRKEFFRACPEIYRYLRWLRNQHYVAVSADDNPVERRPFSEWRPNPQRYLDPDLFGEYYLGPRELTGDDYYTPAHVVELVREGMGGIDLDPASHAVANGVHRIPSIFTISDDGLSKHWYGKVYVNPPFAGWSDWAAKISEELTSGRVKQLTAFMGVPSLTAVYMSKLTETADLLCVSRGRIRCWGKLVEQGSNSPSSGHALLYFGQHTDRMASLLSGIGTCWKPERKR